ncbi:hypothetical protein L873DRAFT_530065 [Choiromyces venosus 120613-1]|uniref:Uncharacterized protein n=1 Tax=Choiromyces venosus 120613-1 TaxID=1336337 RepID=A0A3N4KB98_9PEZI|nr:hypothetical protein L873DRAFT_530065 [Choiromyces venosus 120613-1]
MFVKSLPLSFFLLPISTPRPSPCQSRHYQLIISLCYRFLHPGLGKDWLHSAKKIILFVAFNRHQSDLNSNSNCVETEEEWKGKKKKKKSALQPVRPRYPTPIQSSRREAKEKSAFHPSTNEAKAGDHSGEQRKLKNKIYKKKYLFIPCACVQSCVCFVVRADDP